MVDHEQTSPVVPLQMVDDGRPPRGRMEHFVEGNRLLIHIPPCAGWPSWCLGLSAGLLTAIALVAAWGFLPQARGVAQLLFLAFAAAVFAAGAISHLLTWLGNRFGHTYVLVESGRLVIRRELLGRTRSREFALDAASRAELVTAYRGKLGIRNIEAVAMTGLGRRSRFGVFLSRAEKLWLVERINRHLDHRVSAV